MPAGCARHGSPDNDWAAKRAYFSGVTHGSNQVQTDTAGIPIVLYMPSQLKVNGFEGM